MTVDVIALARVHLPYDWAAKLCIAAEAGDKKALRRLNKWLALVAPFSIKGLVPAQHEPDDASGYAEPCQSGWYEE